MLSRAAVLIGFLLLAPAAALAGEIVLDGPRRSALAGLPSLVGAAPAAEALAGKVVVVAFFASWCPPCHPEFDHLNETADRFGEDGVEILAVNIFEVFGGFTGTARREAFLAKKAPRFTVLAEGESIAALFGEVARIPTVFVFGRDGRPVLHFIHEQGATKTHVSGEELFAAVAQALEG